MNKESTRLLVIIGLIFLLVCSWYMLIDDTAKEASQYNGYIQVAREKAGSGLYQVALENYELARGMRDSIELRDEMANVYQDYGNTSLYEEFCTQMITDYPYEKVGYERLAKLYGEGKSYSMFFKICTTAQKRKVSSPVIDKLAKELEYAYSLNGVNAVEIRGFSGGGCPALRTNGYWGLYNEKGKTALSFSYVKLSVYANELIYAETRTGEYVMIDITGKHISRVSDGRKIEDCSALNADKMAVKYDGKYHYCDSSFKELFGSYDFATVFNGGVAAVMNNGKWAIINEEGKQITDYIFEDIKLDDSGVAFRSGRAIAKKDGAYIVIDSNGKQVGKKSWDDADAFNAEMIAAVQKNGKWGFVDSDGKEVVACQYSGAKSFSNGMAAVQINGKWGYISSTDYGLKIEAVFDDAMDFTKSGSAFVKEDATWSILQIYRLA